MILDYLRSTGVTIVSMSAIKPKSKLIRGFTIVELLVVIVVIAILAAISIVAYNGMKERADTAKTASAALQILAAPPGRLRFAPCTCRLGGATGTMKRS